MAGIKEACGVFGIYDLDGGKPNLEKSAEKRMIWMEEMLFHPFIMALHHFSIVDRSLADLQFPEQTESVVMSSSIRIWDW